MDFKCESCGYDLTGVARTRRTDVRCPECGRDNALGVDVSCIRCGYDLSARARSNLHRVTCSECGEENAVRRELRVSGYLESRLIIFARCWVFTLPIFVAILAGIMNGLYAFHNGSQWYWAVGMAWTQTVFANCLIGIVLWATLRRLPPKWQPPNPKWSMAWMVMSGAILPLMAAGCVGAVLMR